MRASLIYVNCVNIEHIPGGYVLTCNGCTEIRVEGSLPLALQWLSTHSWRHAREQMQQG